MHLQHGPAAGEHAQKKSRFELRPELSPFFW
jgi:hypothetical protein